MLIREAQSTDAAAIAKVDVDSWRTTYASVVPKDVLANLSYEGRERSWRDVLSEHSSTHYVYVAEDDRGSIMGFASGGPEREGDTVYKGELYTLYLLEQYQRRGIGRQLTLAVVTRLLQEGFRSMLVWVLSENPACRFYEALGGKRIYEKNLTIGGKELVGVAYGWRGINDFSYQ